MPLLSALDMIESRGLPRLISLLSEVEAQTLDRCEQIEQQDTTFARARSTDSTSFSVMPGEMVPHHADARQLVIAKVLPESASRHHSRSWNGSSQKRKTNTSNTRAWANAISAMEELRTVSPHQPVTAPVQKLDRSNFLDKKKQHPPATEEDLCAEIETWAWSEAYHISSADIALTLWSLAAVKSKNKKLTRDLTIRANALAKSFTPAQMAMTWMALADLGETPALAGVGEILEQVREMALAFTPRHAKQTVASMRKCGVYDGFVFVALNRLAETAE